MALGRYADAERELLESDKLLASSPDLVGTRQPLTEALIKLDEAWSKPEQAAAWRAKLPATQPAATQP